VVEDEVLIRLMMTDYLRQGGFKVFETASADEALEVLRANKIDVLVTDIRMPGPIDGIKLAVLARSQWPDMKIIIASAYSPQPPTPEIMDAFIGKPYDPERLLNWIQKLLREQRDRRS
jgi:CheY-like chemotaxis protein